MFANRVNESTFAPFRNIPSNRPEPKCPDDQCGANAVPPNDCVGAPPAYCAAHCFNGCQHCCAQQQRRTDLQSGQCGAIAPSPGTPANRPLTIISGGGKFYDLNLDFGCCFGTLLPPDPAARPGPGVASLDDIELQTASWRTLLVNGSTDGLRMYAHNTEQDFGDAHTEIAHSSNVTLYGGKTEDNYVAVWIRDSSDVAVLSFGGDFTAFANTTTYPSGKGHLQVMPSTFRVQRSTNVRLVNMIDTGRVTREGCFGERGSPECNALPVNALVAAGFGVDARLWNMVLEQSGDERCDPITAPSKCAATRILDRPVLWSNEAALVEAMHMGRGSNA